MTTLHRAYRADIPLGEVVESLPAVPSGAVALLYAPDRCRLGCLGKGAVVTARGLADLDAVFEARLFNAYFEVRWLQTGVADGRRIGRAAIIHDGGTNVGDAWKAAGPIEVEGLEQRYILWGQGSEHQVASGWSALVSARIGTLDVPLEVPTGARVRLTAREYLAECEDGNMVVAEERLTGLELDGDR